MLWRSLVDNFFEYSDENLRIGMKQWSEGFVFGGEGSGHPSYKYHRIVLNKQRISFAASMYLMSLFDDVLIESL